MVGALARREEETGIVPGGETGPMIAGVSPSSHNAYMRCGAPGGLIVLARS
jgi:hypothetical protein